MEHAAPQAGPARRIVIADNEDRRQTMRADVLHAAGYTTISGTRSAGAYEHTSAVASD